MKVTVCELHDERRQFEQDWANLVTHVRANTSDLVLLNELPFAEWFGVSPEFKAETWQAVVAEHALWLTERLAELAPATVLGTTAVTKTARRLNQGFIWQAATGYQATHEKYYLPNEAGVWEANWYQPSDGSFELVASEWGKIGFLICSELWALGRAQAYGKAGAHLLVTPRATGQTSVEKWLVGGRTAAIVAGAFSLSSNRVSATAFGGQGWVIDPDGEVLALTSAQQPVITVEIDLHKAELAKATYPRYVLD